MIWSCFPKSGHILCLQVDPKQSQLLLLNSERFGLLLAENMNKIGMPLTIQADNICKS